MRQIRAKFGAGARLAYARNVVAVDAGQRFEYGAPCAGIGIFDCARLLV